MTHILVISHAAVVPGYRRKFELMANSHPEVDITILTPTAWNEGGRRVVGMNVSGANWRARPLPVMLGGMQYGHFYLRMAVAIKAAQPDIVYLEEEPPSVVAVQVSILCERLCPRAKLLFFTWENLIPHWTGWRGVLYPKMEQRTWRSATAAIAGTQMARQLLQVRGFSREIHVLPQVGIDVDRFSPADGCHNRNPARHSGPAASATRVVGYAGRLIPEKGVDLLLQAVAPLADMKLVIVGSGPERERLESLARCLGLSGDRIEFIAASPRDQMPARYRRMDALVLPSRTVPTWSEQFGRVMLEAMACGVPVVAARSGAIPEVVGDACMTFPEGDAPALRECLRVLLCDTSNLSQWGRRGREHVMKHYTDEIIARKLWYVFESLQALPA